MNKLHLLAATTLLCLMLPALSADAASKAQVCATCHNANMNSLAGKDKAHIVTQMKAIRAGDKAHPPVLSDFSDKDIEAVAERMTNDK